MLLRVADLMVSFDLPFFQVANIFIRTLETLLCAVAKYCRKLDQRLNGVIVNMLDGRVPDTVCACTVWLLPFRTT